ncbi:uncharacterized protein LOC119189631 [Manduca sexta]|uniref:uncharacterized protein LOC119189631 n=1 Tax=Manduca sexta TaxID=7130 RepID=UPI00188FEE86|nr:uncharacterized protein LOC119189631 [Manduca sexta]
MVSHVCALVSCDRNAWSESETVALGAWLTTPRCAARSRTRPPRRCCRWRTRWAARRRRPAASPRASPPTSATPRSHTTYKCRRRRFRGTRARRWRSWCRLGAARCSPTRGTRWCSWWGAAWPRRARPAPRARLLRELERAPAPAHRYHTEHLKVSVGVSKLQSLFGRLQNNGHGQETKTTNKL